MRSKLQKMVIYRENSKLASFLFSYPPTPVFASVPSIESPDFFDFSLSQEVLLYIHIPFCAQICAFCNVYKEKITHYDDIIRYKKVLFHELEVLSLSATGKSIQGVYIAGGTPTLLKAQDLDEVFQKIHTLFKIEGDAYIEIDATPASLTPEKLAVLQKNNVRQLSIGIQSLDPDVLGVVDRRAQNSEILTRLAHCLQDYAFHLHFDFIVGLPGEKWENIQPSLVDFIEKFHPYSISINSYDNTIDTVLHREYKEYFSDPTYSHMTDARVYHLQSWIKNTYGIERKKTFYFSHFQERQATVLAAGAGAFGFMRGVGVYRNLPLPEYLSHPLQKKIIPLTERDHKVMFLIHNYTHTDFSQLYMGVFHTSFEDDFSVFLSAMIEKKYASGAHDGKVIFSFPSHRIAKFEFIDLYSSDIVGYYIKKGL